MLLVSGTATPRTQICCLHCSSLSSRSEWPPSLSQWAQPPASFQLTLSIGKQSLKREAGSVKHAPHSLPLRLFLLHPHWAPAGVNLGHITGRVNSGSELLICQEEKRGTDPQALSPGSLSRCRKMLGSLHAGVGGSLEPHRTTET